MADEFSGGHTEITARFLNDLIRRVRRIRQISSVAPITVRKTPGGTVIGIDLDDPIQYQQQDTIRVIHQAIEEVSGTQTPVFSVSGDFAAGNIKCRDGLGGYEWTENPDTAHAVLRNPITAILQGNAHQRMTILPPAPSTGTFTIQFNPNSKQTVTVTGASGGSFTLQYSSAKTGGISFDASADAVQSAIGSLETVGPDNVEVAGPDGGPWVVTLKNALAYGFTGTLIANGTNLDPSTASVSVVVSSNSETTSPISWATVDGVAIQNALQALPGIGPGGVTVDVCLDNATDETNITILLWDFYFAGGLANTSIQPLQITGTTVPTNFVTQILTGSDATLEPAYEINGHKRIKLAENVFLVGIAPVASNPKLGPKVPRIWLFDSIKSEPTRNCIPQTTLPSPPSQSCGSLTLNAVPSFHFPGSFTGSQPTGQQQGTAYTVALSWNIPTCTNPIKKWVVLRHDDGANLFVPIAVLDGAVTSYTDTTPCWGTFAGFPFANTLTYNGPTQYSVRGYDAYGNTIQAAHFPVYPIWTPPSGWPCFTDPATAYPPTMTVTFHDIYCASAIDGMSVVLSYAGGSSSQYTGSLSVFGQTLSITLTLIAASYGGVLPPNLFTASGHIEMACSADPATWIGNFQYIQSCSPFQATCRVQYILLSSYPVNPRCLSIPQFASGPTASVGSSGPCIWDYGVSANTPAYGECPVFVAAIGGTNVLSANPVTITWGAVPGATSYNVYRTGVSPFSGVAVPSSLGFIGQTAGFSFVDNGIAPTSHNMGCNDGNLFNGAFFNGGGFLTAVITN